MLVEDGLLRGFEDTVEAGWATLEAARSVHARGASPLRDELMAAAGLVRRIGTNLNQAVAKLNRTGQRSDDVLPQRSFACG